ncbi:hypothetical protein FKR81_20660 [Lentzea tibetensis]|uniref:FHA domain-containing protein n=1 Tax=Lentzea tibetensis TaxID=2591470 RepID=A0A563ESF7_9PSEU|nr:hypothetical protein [Lentzea tibetensis]TWP50580.1 hypothetical protein FKR81_20660 [Lentzea tibetensis]
MDSSLAITMSFGALSRTMSPGEEAVFGRSPECAFQIDPDDTAISRKAGVVRAENDVWFVVNTSVACTLEIVDDFGFPSVLAPGRKRPLQGEMRIRLSGNQKHEIVVHAPLTDAPVTEDEPEGQPTAIGASVALTPEERAVLVALFAGYLHEGAKYDPYPRTYDAAAARLRMTPSKVRKKVEYLRTRLTRAGVPNMDGLLNLAQYVLAKRLITKDDLGLL